uniref:Uncharacterized protein n=1 Tax=Leersia perrieri TaxID=77586 RepID=A0A0D9VC39_9ORYZ
MSDGRRVTISTVGAETTLHCTRVRNLGVVATVTCTVYFVLGFFAIWAFSSDKWPMQTGEGIFRLSVILQKVNN